MKRTILQVTGVLLIAATVWAFSMVAWTLWYGEAPGDTEVSLAAGDERFGVVADVPAADRLQMENGGEIRLGAIRVPSSGEPFSEEGRQAALALAQDKRVRLEGMEDGGAYVYLPEGQLLQELLIAGGYARVAEDAPDDEVVDRLLAAQREARDANIGLWGGYRPDPLPTAAASPQPIACEPSLVPGDTLGPEEAKHHMGEEKSVVFLPARASSSNQNITLAPAESEEIFSVLIPSGLAMSEKEPQLRYLHRCIVATGRIERGLTGGPQIAVRSFEQIVVLH